MYDLITAQWAKAWDIELTWTSGFCAGLFGTMQIEKILSVTPAFTE